ncbi:SLACS retrotransposable element [Trypanosoma cruzi]|nr:SLACS retrotransposable element [Trypanosoma cruzi]
MTPHHTNNPHCPRKKWRWRRKVWEATRGTQKHRETLRARKTVDTHFHTTRHPRCWIPCGVWQVGATTSSRDRVVGNTYDRIFMQYTVSRNGWTSLMKRSSPKDWFGATHAGKFARPACEHGQHIAHAVASTHVVRKTWRHSGRSTVRRLPDHTIPRRRRFWERTPAVEWPTTPATDPRQDPWLQERVPTRRYLHKREWPNWLDVCRTVMLGYNASAPEERSRKQVAIMDLVRQHLRLPENPRSRRQATRTNHDKQHTTDPPPDHCNTTTVVRGAMRPRKTGRSRSAMRLSNRTQQHTSQSAYSPRPTYTRRDA